MRHCRQIRRHAERYDRHVAGVAERDTRWI
jgi:hypothetical protein